MDPGVQAIIDRKRAEDPQLDDIMRRREEDEEKPNLATMRTSSTIHEQDVANLAAKKRKEQVQKQETPQQQKVRTAIANGMLKKTEMARTEYYSKPTNTTFFDPQGYYSDRLTGIDSIDPDGTVVISIGDNDTAEWVKKLAALGGMPGVKTRQITPTLKNANVAEGKKPDRYHIVGKDGKPVNLASYADRASAIKDRDEKYPGAVVQQVGPRGKVKGVAEGLPGSLSKSDYTPGATKKYTSTNCTTCHGRQVMYKTPDGKLHADNKQGAKKISCPVCKGTGDKQGVAEQAQICSECGGPSYSNPMLAEKKDACYHKVKSRVKVWPSAYASGQLVQCRKRGASNWGTGGKKK